MRRSQNTLHDLKENIRLDVAPIDGVILERVEADCFRQAYEIKHHIIHAVLLTIDLKKL